jgi:hypothetical protein
MMRDERMFFIIKNFQFDKKCYSKILPNFFAIKFFCGYLFFLRIRLNEKIPILQYRKMGRTYRPGGLAKRRLPLHFMLATKVQFPTKLSAGLMPPLRQTAR